MGGMFTKWLVCWTQDQEVPIGILAPFLCFILGKYIPMLGKSLKIQWDYLRWIRSLFPPQSGSRDTPGLFMPQKLGINTRSYRLYSYLTWFPILLLPLPPPHSPTSLQRQRAEFLQPWHQWGMMIVIQIVYRISLSVASACWTRVALWIPTIFNFKVLISDWQKSLP